MSFGSFLYGSFRRFGGPQEILVICSFAWFLHRNASFRLGGTRQSLFFTDGPNLGLFVWGHIGWVPWALSATSVGSGATARSVPFVAHFWLIFTVPFT